jgi:hypothetical protein
MNHRTRTSPPLAKTLGVLGLTLILAIGAGELVLRFLDGRFDGAVERLGWGWARLLVFALWVGFAADWIGRQRGLHLRKR